MKRIHALLIALAVAFAVVAGTFAAIRTTELGTAASSPVSPTEIARQTRILDRAQAQLKRALHKRPPKLPPLPATSIATQPAPAVPAPQQAPATQPAVAAPSVITTAARTPTTRTSSSATTGENEGHEHESATTESHEHEGDGGGQDD